MWHVRKNINMSGCSVISGRTIGILAFALISNSDRFTKKKSTACNLKFVSNSVLFFDLGGLGISVCGILGKIMKFGLVERNKMHLNL